MYRSIFLDGTGFLKPMTMTDVAESLGIHTTSTVKPGHQGKVYPVSVRNHIDEASVYGIRFQQQKEAMRSEPCRSKGTDEELILQRR